MDMQKCQTCVSWASMDQVSSTSTGHLLELWCATDLLQMHRASVLHMSTSLTPGNPGQKQQHLSLLLPSPCASRPAPGHSCLPTLPWLFPCWAWGCSAITFPRLSIQSGHLPWAATPATFANKEINIILQMLTFYQGSCNVCCSCTWTCGARELRENCNFSFSKTHLQIRTLQLKKCKFSDNLTGDYFLSKHIE